MKRLSRLAFLAAGAALLVASQSAPANTTTPLGDGGVALFTGDLAAARASTFTDAASPEAKAIDKALSYFADTSTTYSEDLKDVKAALKVLRKVFGSTSTTIGDFVFILNRDAVSATLNVSGLATVAYENASLKSRLGVGLKIQKAGGTANEQSRFGKYVAVMNGVQAYAKKKHIDLYVAH